MRRAVVAIALVGCLVAAIAYRRYTARAFRLPRTVIGADTPFIPPASWGGLKERDVVSVNQWDGAITPQVGVQIWIFEPPIQPAGFYVASRCLLRNGKVIDGYRYETPEPAT